MHTDAAEPIEIGSMPSVPGLVFRRFRGPSDYQGITAVGNAYRMANGDEWVASVDEIALWFEALVNCDLARDMMIAEIDGEMIGTVRGAWRQEEDGLYRYNIFLDLLPHWRGHGIRQAMLRWIEARMRRVAAGHPAGAPKQLAARATEQAEDLITLLESEGYYVARVSNTMVRPLDEPIPDFPMPLGLELRPVLPEHHRPIWDATLEAFRDHWGYSPPPEEEYELWRSNPVTFTPQLWQVAWDIERDEVAGQIHTFIDALENETYNRRRGYTETISVRRPYRRRGLARALIVESLRTLKAQGMTESALSVDSENITGATRLYEACGFTVANRSFAYRKPLEESQR